MNQVPVDPVARARAEQKASSKLVGSGIFGTDTKSIAKLIGKQTKSVEGLAKYTIKTERNTNKNYDESKRIVKNTDILVKSYGGMIKSQTAIFKLTKSLLHQSIMSGKKQADIDKKILIDKNKDKDKFKSERDKQKENEQRITNDLLRTLLKDEKKLKKEKGGSGVLGGMFGGIGSILSGLLSNPLVLGGLAALAAPLLGSLIKPWLEKSGFAKTIWDILPPGLKTGLKMLFDPIGAITKAFDWYKDAFTKNIFDPIAKAVGGFTDEIGKFFKDPIGYLKNSMFKPTVPTIPPPPTISGTGQGDITNIPTVAPKETTVADLLKSMNLVPSAPGTPTPTGKPLIRSDLPFQPTPVGLKLMPQESAGGALADVSGLVPEFKTSLEGMAAKYKLLYGEDIPIESGVRTQEQQTWLREHGRPASKKLGAHAGKAVDIGSSATIEKLTKINPDTGMSLLDEFGLYQPYKTGSATQKEEPWHIESKKLTTTTPTSTIDENAKLTKINQSITQQQQIQEQSYSTMYLKSINDKFDEWIMVAKQQTGAIKDNKMSMGPSIVVANPTR
jgi:hypothetical protein